MTLKIDHSALPIDITCPRCGAQPGVPCIQDDADKRHKNFHMISYSFHYERVCAARKGVTE